MQIKILILTALVLLIPEVAYSYIGPGVALSTLLMVLGVIGSIILGIFAVLYYPVKRLIKKIRSKKNKKK